MELQEELYGKIREAWKEKYQGHSDPRIEERADEEWNQVLSHGMVQETALLLEVCNYLRSKDLPWVVNGAAGSSFLLYLLGITRGNPLPAHILNTGTGKVTWLDDVFRDGFDIVRGSYENADGLEFDGHDLLWQIFFGTGTEPVRISVNVPASAEDVIKGFPVPSWAADVKMESTLERFGFWRIELSDLELLCVLDDEKPGTLPVPDAENGARILSHWKDLIGRFGVDPDAIPEPETFSELISLYDLSVYGEIDERTKTMVCDMGFSYDDLYVFQDDYYRYLLRHNVPTERYEDKWRHYQALTQVNPVPKAHVVEHILYDIEQKNY